MKTLEGLTLEEALEQIEGARDGSEVRIYDVDGGGEYPIMGAHWPKSASQLRPLRWSVTGKVQPGVVGDLDLVSKQPAVDWSKFLVDTLVKIFVRRGEDATLRYLRSGCAFYPGGANSLTCDSCEIRDLSRVYSGAQVGEQLPWFGGEQPVPDSVEVNLWMRGDFSEMGVKASERPWPHAGMASDIIAWQITGKVL